MSEPRKYPRVEFTTGDKPTAIGDGVRLLLDGQDITRLTRGIAFDAVAGEANHVRIDLCLPALDVDILADVTLNVEVAPGYVLIEEPLPNGGRRISAERKAES